jgi:hypothetical protein
MPSREQALLVTQRRRSSGSASSIAASGGAAPPFCFFLSLTVGLDFQTVNISLVQRAMSI